MRVHFGLEGNIIPVPTSAFRQMISVDCPGSSKERHRAEKMRSFMVPPELTIPGARDLPKNGEQTMAIFAAVVGEEDTILIVDHNRLTRLHIMSLARPWSADDMTVDSPVRRSRAKYSHILTYVDLALVCALDHQPWTGLDR